VKKITEKIIMMALKTATLLKSSAVRLYYLARGLKPRVL